MRIERDSLGEIEVPEDKYWGAQTERSLKYFSIGSDKMPIEVIHALALIKRASAVANCKLKKLDDKLANLIIRVSDEIIAGELDPHFPLHVWMTGSGTQSNMNVNEVISNRAIELIGGTLGSHDPLHPNDHVNMSQSSNDTFPSAMYITTAQLFVHTLIPQVTLMQNALEKKAHAWRGVIKVARTHMQDAVPMSLGDGFAAYATLLQENIERLEFCLKDVYKLALGGTAIGSGINAPSGFDALAIAEIAKQTKLPFVPAKDKFAVQGAHDALIAASSQMKTVACSLFKIANDIRLLSCGPRSGFNELIIPSNEPGSSIMPGKVNPTQCEAMAMAMAQVMSNDVAVSFGGASGMLEMNVYKPLMIFNIIQSAKLIADCSENFTRYLLEETQPNYARLEKDVEHSLMLVTALSPVIGYDKASELAHYAHAHHISLREANYKLQLLSDEEFTRHTDPTKMI